MNMASARKDSSSKLHQGLVCIVTSHAFPESIGGEETFIRQFGRFMSSQSIDYTVVSSSTLPSLPHLDPARVPAFSVPLIGFELHSSLFAMLAALRMMKVHQRRRLSLVYAVETGHVALAAIFVSRLLRVPLVVHSHIRRSELLKRIREHRVDWRTWPYWAVEKSIDKFVASHARSFIAVSQSVADFLHMLGVPAAHIRVIPSAIEVDAFRNNSRIDSREKLGIPADAFVIGSLGRIEESQKGVGVLLEAYKLYSARESSTSLLLIGGEGPDLKSLTAKAQTEDLADVRFLGFVADVSSFLSAIDVFVLPSFLEGRPIVLLEAMASGCAVVASRIPGVAEFAEGAALLTTPGDAEGLAAAIMSIHEDSRLRDSLSQKSQQVCKNFSAERIFPEILAVCLGALSKTGS